VAPIHHHLLGILTLNWLLRTVMPFCALGIAAFLLPRLVAEFFAVDRYLQAQGMYLLIGLLLQLCGSIALIGMRTSDLAMLRNMFANTKALARPPKT
jgi:hypothetical protein